MDLSECVVMLTDATSVQAVLGGHQSRVFDVTRRDGQRVVAKVLDASVVDADVVATRVRTVASLAELDPRVCRPVPLDGNLVTALRDGADGDLLVVCYEYADGVAFDAASVSDAKLMGETLAELHVSLRRVALPDLPVVAALRAVPSNVAGPFQLLHGDFNHENLRYDGGTVRVFDFDDCGFGPCMFDVANALYMVLFASMTGGTTARFRPFEPAFLVGYSSASGEEVERDVVNRFIDLRVRALESWLDDLATAPIGVRAASPQWHNTLRSFIRAYDARLSCQVPSGTWPTANRATTDCVGDRRSRR